LPSAARFPTKKTQQRNSRHGETGRELASRLWDQISATSSFAADRPMPNPHTWFNEEVGRPTQRTRLGPPTFAWVPSAQSKLYTEAYCSLSVVSLGIIQYPSLAAETGNRMNTRAPANESRIPLRIESVAKHFGEITALAGVLSRSMNAQSSVCSAPMAQASLRLFAASWAACALTRVASWYSMSRRTRPQPGRRWAGCRKTWRSTGSSPAVRICKPSAATTDFAVKRCTKRPSGASNGPG